MTARARRHALSRNDENVNEAAGEEGGGAHTQMLISPDVRPLVRARYREASRRETEEGDGIRGKGIALIVSRRYSLTRGRSRTNFFPVPLKSAA